MVFIKALTLALLAGKSVADSDTDRLSAPRLRSPDASAHHASSIADLFPAYDKFFKSVGEDPIKLVGLLNDAKNSGGSELTEEKDQFNAVMEAFESLTGDLAMSMPLTDGPSQAPVAGVPTDPAVSSTPSAAPMNAGGPETASPSNPSTGAPDVVVEPTSEPQDGTTPSTGTDPTDEPTVSPTALDLLTPGVPEGVETLAPSLSGNTIPGQAPFDDATESPTSSPIESVTTDSPVAATDAPSLSPTPNPTETPTTNPTQSPTTYLSLERCPGISAEQRVAMILSILDSVADPAQVRDPSLAQGKATEWILAHDEFQVCPDNEKLIQRWAMAVLYYSTGGDSWFQCSANLATGDNCGNEDPFVRGEDRFLSGAQECDWAGISCNDRGCVTEIEFEENNLDGTIPSEIALLSDLIIWGMERGHLTSTIPTEISRLTNLIFIDLDYNELTGTLSSELLGLSSLMQLDLNNNKLSGNIEGIDQYPNMEFLQLHDNLFTGTVPDSIGAYKSLSAFTLHESGITGAMPSAVCDLLLSAGKGGSLTSLIADCSLPNPNIICTCCTDCRSPQ